MLSSRRGGWVWILRLVSVVEPSTNLSFIIHYPPTASTGGRPDLRRIGWSSADVTHTRRHRVTQFWSTMRCGDPLLKPADSFLYDSRRFVQNSPLGHTKESLDGAWLAPFIFKPVGLFDI